MKMMKMRMKQQGVVLLALLIVLLQQVLPSINTCMWMKMASTTKPMVIQRIVQYSIRYAYA